MLDQSKIQIAEVKYGDADFRLLNKGTHVICAVTGVFIPLRDLRYWSVELQEAYKDAHTSFERYKQVFPERIAQATKSRSET